MTIIGQKRQLVPASRLQKPTQRHFVSSLKRWTVVQPFDHKMKTQYQDQPSLYSTLEIENDKLKQVIRNLKRQHAVDQERLRMELNQCQDERQEYQRTMERAFLTSQKKHHAHTLEVAQHVHSIRTLFAQVALTRPNEKDRLDPVQKTPALPVSGVENMQLFFEQTQLRLRSEEC